MSRPVRAALYTRVSTRAQADKHGTAYQREALERMAEARGWTVVGVFADEGWSGRREDRPGLAAMMKAVRRGEVDVVATWRWDRLARSLSHLVALLQELRSRNVALASHQEGLDTSTPIGTAMFQIAGAMAELEGNLARERVQAGLDAARARGVKVGRPRGALTADEAATAGTEHGIHTAAASTPP
ncbi:MAG: recombinase family protein [Deltaproteobacteria bacterium]|nr:MAG: recombinase family protein [Deltaproteobacteria bacterium]